jgi:hypothetical protein
MNGDGRTRWRRRCGRGAQSKCEVEGSRSARPPSGPQSAARHCPSRLVERVSAPVRSDCRSTLRDAPVPGSTNVLPYSSETPEPPSSIMKAMPSCEKSFAISLPALAERPAAGADAPFRTSRVGKKRPSLRPEDLQSLRRDRRRARRSVSAASRLRGGARAPPGRPSASSCSQRRLASPSTWRQS